MILKIGHVRALNSYEQKQNLNVAHILTNIVSHFRQLYRMEFNKLLNY